MSSFSRAAKTTDEPSPHGTNVVPFTKAKERVRIADFSLPWGEDVIERLNQLVGLQYGWDGYGAGPVSFENAFFALKILERICNPETPAPQLVPGSSGDLQIEWHEEGGNVELHVQAPNHVEGWRANDDTGPDGEEARFRSDFTLAATWIDELAEPVGAPDAKSG